MDRMMDHVIRRGDGRTVEFHGRKIAYKGRAAVYETCGGNRVFKYAPLGNALGLIVEKLPEDKSQTQAVLEKHCSAIELEYLLRALGEPSSIFIE